MKLKNGDLYIDKDGDLCLIYQERGTREDKLLIYLSRSEVFTTYSMYNSQEAVEAHLKTKTNGIPIMNMKNIFKAILEHANETK